MLAENGGTMRVPQRWWFLSGNYACEVFNMLNPSQAVSAYTTAPSSARAEVAKAEMDRDKHIFDLNERMTEMFERIQSTSMPPEVLATFSCTQPPQNKLACSTGPDKLESKHTSPHSGGSRA